MKSTSKYTLSVYWQHAKKYKRQMWTIYPLMVIAQLAEDFVSPLIIASLLDNFAAGDIQAIRDMNLWLIFGAIIFIEMFSLTMWNRIVRIFWRFQENVMRDLAMTCFNHLQSMSFRFFSDRFAGSIVNQVNKFVGSFERLTDVLTWNVFKLIISVIFTIIIIGPRAPIIAIALVLLISIYVPVVWYFRRRLVPYTSAWAASETARTGQLADSISNVMAVKSFSNEKLEEKLMKERVDEVFDLSMKTMRLNMNQEYGSGTIQRSMNMVVIIFALLLAINGVIEVGTIYLALTFSIAILRRLWDLNNTFRSLVRVFGDTHDMSEILQITPEVADPDDPIEITAKKGAVAFDNVTFRYPDERDDKALFQDLNLTIKPGEKIGLVGPSGGGKTTITKLLLRFLDINEGVIEIDGQNIADARQADVRRYISYVPQEPLLFHRTLEENIRYGNLDASDKQVRDAAKKAHAAEFIHKLADGYDTLVGERGVKLSGGQKQRVAIARSMLKDARILVLDEATSALDSESEQLIQDALWKLMEGKTALVIAHRLSTIQKMDRIIVMDDGKIVEEGTHDQLVKKKNGLYARLWSHQSGGFIQD